jgi:outer membrane lipoprotein-sorting protein
MKKILLYFILPLFALSAFSQNQSNKQVSEADLDKILKNTREYCRKLNGAALNFVCLEEVSEKTFQIVQSFQWRGPRVMRNEVRHKYLYDYQYIRKNGRLTEKRILLEEDGRKKRDKQTSLLTTMFQYENVIFGPVNLLVEERQFFFNYKITGSQGINGVKTIVLEATPKPWASQDISGGTIWVSEGDFSILKIEWNQEKMKRSEIIMDMAKRYKGTPVVTQTIEFEFEKNGIRFPSRFFIEEAYINKRGKTIIHSETNVIYRDYKYFTVETKVKYDL